jgi:hypothetical protein
VLEAFDQPEVSVEDREHSAHEIVGDLGTNFDVPWIYNRFPDRGLERLLNLVDSLSRKIADIDRLGMLDASLLGGDCFHLRISIR